MIEVGGTRPGEAQTASLTLTDIVLDDGGKTEGVNFKQASTDGKGGNESLVQDAIVATYNGTAEIILASGATLRNFGGMSAVRLSGGDLVMEDGSQICDDTDGVADRTKEKGDYGARGSCMDPGRQLPDGGRSGDQPYARPRRLPGRRQRGDRRIDL